MTIALLIYWLLPLHPLGNVAFVKGNVTLYRQIAAHKVSVTKLAPGYCRHSVLLYPNDRIDIKAGSAVQGTYDRKVLLLFGPKSWVAPEKGVLGGEKAARSLMARRQLGPDDLPDSAAVTQPSDRLDLWPPAGKTMPWLYVDSEGTFALAWTAPKQAATVTVTATFNGKQVGSYTAPAHRKSPPLCPFGWMEDMSLGLILRRQAREDDLSPVTIDLRTDTGQTCSLSCQLVSLRKGRQWDGLISRLNTALQDHAGEDGVFEAWNDVLDNVEDAAPVLRGYWLLKVWSVHPDAFVTRDAVRQLSEESGLTDIATQFSK